MTNRLSYIFISIVLILSSCNSKSDSGVINKIDNNWSFSVQNGIEKTKRSYLLVYAPNKPWQRRLTVVSECERRTDSESIYGECTHDVEIQPINKKFRLTSGEDVIMAQAWGWDTPLIIGTFGYGCCADPNIVKFYTEDGKYIGRLTTPVSANGGNLITGQATFLNSASDGNNRAWFVIQDDHDDDKYYCWVNDSKGEIKKLPVLLSFPDKKRCNSWYIQNFAQYSDRNYISMTFESYDCGSSQVPQKQFFHCTENDSRMSCTASNGP